MNTFWNDLPDLEDITNTIKVAKNCFDNSSYCDDLKESIDIFLDEYINSNIEIYKEYDFNTIIYDYLFDIIVESYHSIIFEFDIDIHKIINETMYCYFMRNNNPRSYIDNRIIKSPNNKKINKLLKY